MHSEPVAQHQWLKQFVGEWSSSMEASMGPDQPPMQHTGTESASMIGDLWVASEGDAEMPDGSRMKSVLTIGYDPSRERFIGTFVASMMTHMWVYEGTLDDSGKKLTLNTVGPNFASEGATALYQDIFEFLSADHRTLTSMMQQPDGTWMQVVKVEYRRK